MKGREATLRTTAEIAPHGILFGIDVDEGFTISYNAGKPTAFNSGIEFYFAFGGETVPVDNLFEIDLTAHNDVNVRVWHPGIFNDAYLQYLYSFENAPAHAVKLKGGTIESGNCTGYTMELYLPYSMFGRSERPEYINLNPGMITPLSDADWVRDYYIFGGEFESSVCKWGKTEMYRFDKNGFVCNKLNITATGGTVTEKYRRDWAVEGDPVILEFAPEEGKKLTSFRLNGVERVNEVERNQYRFICTGKEAINVSAEFTEGGVITPTDREYNVTAWCGYPASTLPVSTFSKDEEITWSGIDDSLIALDKINRTVTAKKEGTCTVTIMGANHTETYNITVKSVKKDPNVWAIKEEDKTYAEEMLGGNYSGTANKTTLFIGDSFFDTREFWTNFDRTYAGYDAICAGIGGTTTYVWEQLAQQYLSKIKPKNIVMHLGTNNVYGYSNNEAELTEHLQRLFTVIHAAAPEAKIYYFAISQRGYSNDEGRKSIVSNVNTAMMKWCEERDFITFLDTESKITPGMLKDEIHPKLEHYSVFTDALQAAGIEIEKS